MAKHGDDHSHCSVDEHVRPTFDHSDQDICHNGVAHLFVLPPNNDGLVIVQGHFVDIERKKSYGVTCVGMKRQCFGSETHHIIRYNSDKTNLLLLC